MPPSLIRVALFFLYGQQGKYLENFAVGMAISLCYVFTQHPTFGQGLQAKMNRLSLWIWRFGVLILTFTAIWHYQVLVNNTSVFTPFFGPLTSVFDWLNEMAIALGYGACMAAILFGGPGLKGLFEWKPMRLIGLISYGLYMWHLPLLLFFRDQILQPYFQTTVYQSYGLYWLWAVVVIVPVALASYIWVEKPWLKLGSHSGSKRKFEEKAA
jgi:peptidoglycan/LPS O-acetylase OafA/YrhL